MKIKKHECADRTAQWRQTNNKYARVQFLSGRAYLVVDTAAHRQPVRIHFCPFCGVKLTKDKKDGLAKKYLDMPVKEFFTPANMRELGIPQLRATRTANCMLNVCTKLEVGQGWVPIYTSVGEVFARFDSKDKLLKIKNFGEKSCNELVDALSRVGVVIK